MIVFADLYDSNTGKEDLDLASNLTVEGVGTFAATFIGAVKGVSPTSAMLTGELQYSMDTVCDRCFCGFNHSATLPIEVYVTFESDDAHPSGAFEGGEEEHYNALETLGNAPDNNDSEYYSIDTDGFDPWTIVGEELMLDLPYRYICSDECTGSGGYSDISTDKNGDGDGDIADADADAAFGDEDVRLPFKNLDKVLGEKRGSKSEK